MTASGMRKSAVHDVLKSSGLMEDRQVDFNEFQKLTKSTTDKMKGYFNGLRNAVEEAEKNGQRPSMSKRELEVQLKLFAKYDVDHSGDIDLEELRDMLKECGWSASNEKLISIVGELGSEDDSASIGFLAFLKLRQYIRRHLIEDIQEPDLNRTPSIENISSADAPALLKVSSPPAPLTRKSIRPTKNGRKSEISLNSISESPREDK